MREVWKESVEQIDLFFFFGRAAFTNFLTRCGGSSASNLLACQRWSSSLLSFGTHQSALVDGNQRRHHVEYQVIAQFQRPECPVMSS